MTNLENTKMKLWFIVPIAFLLSGICVADCPLDHFLIGINQDGVLGTADDNKLFADSTQKYRHSDPNNISEPTWLNWYYPMYYNSRFNRYNIGEPGFDVIKSEDPNHQLVGVPNVDYRIMIQCVGLSPNFSALQSTLNILVDEIGDEFNHSVLSDPHLHLEYRAPAPPAGQELQLQWITYYLYDALGTYQPSEPFTVVFVKDPLDGDLVVDGVVDENDLAQFCEYWLLDAGSRRNDFYQRADINRDGAVNITDFVLLARNWLANGFEDN